VDWPVREARCDDEDDAGSAGGVAAYGPGAPVSAEAAAAQRGVRTTLRTLILLRHGQSEYNAANLFTGWDDPPLTALGEHEAICAGEAIAAADCRPDVVFTSLLRRALDTTSLVLASAGCASAPAHRTWRLNGRHYGALQGRDKTMAADEFGAEQVWRWRRSYDERPPILSDDSNIADPRYVNLPRADLPHAESLRDVSVRLLPYWNGVIAPELLAGRTVLVVAHGNTLRSLIKQLDLVSDEAITRVEVPTARPLLYELGADLAPVVPGGLRLDVPRTAPRSGHA
jgi:2,3-bisphosphoglycerate-dependent phosphoglycerate mutase